MSRPGEKASAFVKKLLESKTYNWFDNKRELLTVLVSTVGYGLIVVTVLFAATVIIVVSLLYFTGPETIKFFEKGKGLVLTSYATIAGAFFIPILIALIPSQTSVKVDKIMQRLFSSLDDTDHVWKKAIELLEWVNDESHTEFYYTSATPYLDYTKKYHF